MTNRRFMVEKDNGFTLVELMLAVVLLSIVLSAVGMYMASSWRTMTEFAREEMTIDEIHYLSRLFTKKVQSSSLITEDNNNQFITFVPKEATGSHSQLRFANGNIEYQRDLSDSGSTSVLLGGATVSFSSSSIADVNGDAELVTMTVSITESELDTTGQYVFTTFKR